MSIYIFSRPIQSGKTTELLNWSRAQKNIAGIVMPDIDGSRKILDLKTNAVFDIECIDASNTTESLTTIGRFNFFTPAFEKANAILLDALAKNPDWLVIDEAGKLELEEKGFYTSIVKAVELIKQQKYSGKLLITVRESLCEEVIAFFKLQDYTIIDSLQDIC